jgi:hypothetical protein
MCSLEICYVLRECVLSSSSAGIPNLQKQGKPLQNTPGPSPVPCRDGAPGGVARSADFFEHFSLKEPFFCYLIEHILLGHCYLMEHILCWHTMHSTRQHSSTNSPTHYLSLSLSLTRAHTHTHMINTHTHTHTHTHSQRQACGRCSSYF